LNPLTRILKSETEAPDAALERLRGEIDKSISKPSIASIKKKMGVKKGKKKKKQEGPTFELVM
jgi:hypothetical protein